jgi:spermidine synthase
MWKVKFGWCIYTSPTGCKVYQNFLYRWLTFSDTAWQTVINRYMPSNPILHYLKALTIMVRAYPNDCCLLGLGGAGIPHMLAKKNHGHSMVAVDSSLDVIQIANKFFKADKISNLSILHQNANDFVRQNTVKFHHLLIDLYDSYHFPDDCHSLEFFQHCKNCLAENGYLAINLANPKEQLAILKLLKQVFNTSIVLTVPDCDNIVVILPQNNDRNSFIRAMNDTHELKKISWTTPWGYIADY